MLTNLTPEFDACLRCEKDAQSGADGCTCQEAGQKLAAFVHFIRDAVVLLGHDDDSLSNLFRMLSDASTAPAITSASAGTGQRAVPRTFRD
jgi:hypothetical protein